MFSPTDRYRDTLAAALAFLGLAALTVPVILWLFRGAVAASDPQTVEAFRTSRDDWSPADYLFTAAALLSAAALASTVLAFYLIIAGARHHRRARRNRAA
ncbi:MAG: hypothetical protein WD749_08620 [Phycisphaerales bacterium]